MANINISAAGSGMVMKVSSTQASATGKKEKEPQVKNGSIFAGDIIDVSGNRVLMKQKEAKKQAAQVLKDQFARDKETTDYLEELRGKIRDLEQEKGKFHEDRTFFTGEKEKLKETYGIQDDSQEQKDLELLEKAVDAGKIGSDVKLTDEEWKRIDEMGEPTEYQKRALVYKEVVDYYSSLIKDVDEVIGAYSRGINSVKNGMLRQHGMDDAMAAAKRINEAASGQVIGMLMEEAQKVVDEKLEQIMEAAKKMAEKREEKEAQLEEAKAEDKEMEETVEAIQEMVSDKDVLQQQLDQIIKEVELSLDKKGILVDKHI